MTLLHGMRRAKSASNEAHAFWAFQADELYQICFKVSSVCILDLCDLQTGR